LHFCIINEGISQIIYVFLNYIVNIKRLIKDLNIKSNVKKNHSFINNNNDFSVL